MEDEPHRLVGAVVAGAVATVVGLQAAPWTLPLLTGGLEGPAAFVTIVVAGVPAGLLAGWLAGPDRARSLKGVVFAFFAGWVLNYVAIVVVGALLDLVAGEATAWGFAMYSVLYPVTLPGIIVGWMLSRAIPSDLRRAPLPSEEA